MKKSENCPVKERKIIWQEWEREKKVAENNIKIHFDNSLGLLVKIKNCRDAREIKTPQPSGSLKLMRIKRS